MSNHIFGIRHHGPGSARSLRRALEQLQPNIILIEGPPDAESLLPLVVSSQMQPPVALLIYLPDNPKESVYYPFAVFSPEWQAIQFGLSNNIPVRFMDLPLTHRMAMVEEVQAENKVISPPSLPQDPLGLLAEAAGYSDGERWWEHMVETRGDSVDLFTGILEAMTAVREEMPASENPIENKREAYMRKTIRTAQKEGFERIAVVCGAWHAPALSQMPAAKEDTALLKGLPKKKVQATWIPWTYGRLSYSSGYGAGIESPGWYHHLWQWGIGHGALGIGNRALERQEEIATPSPPSISITWMAKVARLLRQQDLDASSAHIIEAVRLAESLAALRNRSLPGLPELNEATQTVMCFGSDLPMQLIFDKLIVGESLGKVPDETPMVPLQQDLQRQQKRLRMPADATEKTYDLDLRKENDLARSHLLHRLNLLDIPWGQFQQTRGKKGTFHEFWLVQWHPEFAVNLIEAGVWGNTIADAANVKACSAADTTDELPVLTGLLDKVILSDLPDAVIHLMSRLQNAAALTSDVTHLMNALPPLANVMRYGNVRQTDTAMISHVVDGLVARICISLPGACVSLDDDAAAQMYENVVKVNNAIGLLQNEEHITSWRQVLVQIADNINVHGLISGRCCRLLLDAEVLDAAEAARRMGLALSTANEPSQAGAWVEGFLKGSGLLLLHDDKLWQVLDNWVSHLSEDFFVASLPLLRRTFATFSEPERRQMGERVKNGIDGNSGFPDDENDINQENAVLVLPILKQFLGV
ncbi:hypothetical protein Riv7116_6514 [Rivularia sp. PCC 7116]|uniref:DUF5682 family protein n=1 Tax=Rivularia sp. PCC 7116 TaxID=373994 RepID=UPI00029F453A|nr:DUF5682 family protein [Rivularia sp. PCC 7116]AFY58842.1 hypothetical protein Riv7116_6514 [Rivularia sp. PCC 7116]